MTNRLSSAFSAGVLAAGAFAPLAAIPAAAHHSHAMFDSNAEQTITGTVKSFAFQNPHVYLFVDVPGDSNGQVTTYVVEMSNVQNMISHGITAATFKPGDNVTVRMNPLRNSRPGGSYVGISKDGQEFGRRAEP
jgi:Family of unknown function (DUF6152)